MLPMGRDNGRGRSEGTPHILIESSHFAIFLFAPFI